MRQKTKRASRQWMEETRLAKLKSTNRRTLLDALIDIYTDTTSGPSADERLRLMQLLRHSDSDIRAETVNVAGTHWQLEEAYPILLRMISGVETDQVVLAETCTALGVLVAAGKGDQREVAKRLGAWNKFTDEYDIE